MKDEEYVKMCNTDMSVNSRQSNEMGNIRSIIATILFVILISFLYIIVKR